MSEIVKRLESLKGDLWQDWQLDAINEAIAELSRLTTALENARKDALEEAAKLFDENASRLRTALQNPTWSLTTRQLADVEIETYKSVAAAIRSLTPTQKAT